MGSPCEVQVDGEDTAAARRIGRIVEQEARRIEEKYSRYRVDSVISRINAAAGEPISVDEETAGLLDLATQTYQLSNGLFDISSGVLRKAWTFDGSDRIPDHGKIRALLPFVGWHKAHWQRPQLTLAKGMEIDMGGIGKEYAVDRAIALARAASNLPVLVNFGGDLAVTGPRCDGAAWRIVIESVDETASEATPAWLEVFAGAVTTSGDARRYVERDGKRYSHILDPRTGSSVRGAPRAVTVAADSCMAAGILSTLAMLHGRHAERFLKREGAKAWVTR
jgi:thiamine biosynthesis lipoprotein